MKVLQQLIQHFWQRGALTPDQAHYLVEHGFVRADDLDAYEPRDGDRMQHEADAEPPEIDVLLPDEMDHAEAELAASAGPRRKGGKSAPKLPDLSSEQLGEQLEEILQAREPWTAALAEVAGAAEPKPAVALRQMPEDDFRRRLRAAVQARPGVLADLWEYVDDTPFHDLLARPGVKGRPARAFGVVLRAADAAAWGPVAWILQVPAVQTVANLLAVRRRLLAAVLWLYENHGARLARCLQRPARPAPSWDRFGFGMVIVHNARAWPTSRAPAGFRVDQRLDADGWREAWTAAMNLDAAHVTPYFLNFFGGVEALTAADYNAENLAAGSENVALVCPYEWKV